MIEIVRKADVFNDYGIELLQSGMVMQFDREELLKIVQAAVDSAKTSYFLGADEGHCYNRVISAEDITAIFNGTKKPEDVEGWLEGYPTSAPKIEIRHRD
jgi:hypothetical protein